jgi:alanine racemase
VTASVPEPALDERLVMAGLPPLPRTAWLDIDLDALAANLEVLRTSAGLNVPIHPVVKADAYGHGAVPIARALEAAGADGLCVATIDEAVELRDGGLTVPILVMYPIPAGWLDAAVDGALDLSVGEPALLDRLLAALDERAGEATLRLQLEVETGLGRGGIPVDEVAGVAVRLAQRPDVRLTGLWTHLQAVEDAPRTAAQLERFETAVSAVLGAGVELPSRHAAASAGIIADGVAAYEGTRPGLAIYGLVPDELGGTRFGDEALGALRPVLSLHARPVRVADLPAGWGISYGPTFTTSRPSRIATLPLGYGDGWARTLSNRAEALVRGVRCPIVGNVAMDACMVDVTDVPGPPVDVDDLFTLIGEQDGDRITVRDLALTRTTIAWEVVATMARRLPRVYHSAAGPVFVRFLAQGRS